ncbi:MAG TPA: amidohydrolase family protein [Thermoanaerobaculia bacterium]|nr:amidohydrolase family protein [Thermoanaerobaculia bacterium]
MAPSRLLPALILSLLVSCRTAAPPPVATEESAPPDGSLAFVGVNLVPMTRELGVVRAQTVIVRDGRIETVGPAATTPVPAGAERIEGRGRYLMPGLADMHVHLEYFESPAVLELFLASGVTFVRNMDGRPWILEWKRAIDAGELEGPAIYTAGPLLDGSPPALPDNTVLATEEEARAAVAGQQAAGYDFIKVYTNLQSKIYEAILDEALQRGMPVAGHVPRRSTMRRALEGHASIEHLADFDELIESDDSPVRGRWDWSKLYLAMPADPQKTAAAAAQVAAAGVAVVPALVQAQHALARPEVLASWLAREELTAVPPDAVTHWENRVRAASARLDDEDWQIVERGAANRLALVKALHAAGVTILAGTDTPNPFVVPGASIHRELQLLVAAGLTPKAALAAATREAARFVGQEDEWGTVERGKRADLVLLAGNPLRSIAATATPVVVMVRGVVRRAEPDRR